MQSLTTPGPRRERATIQDMLIVDLDVHVHETPADLIPYSESPWTAALGAIKDAPHAYFDIPSFSPGNVNYQPSWPTGQETARTVTNPNQMREELSRIHVDIGIIFPDNLLKLPVISNDDYAAALARAYNAWLVDKWCRPGDGLLGCITACPQVPEDAAEEIRKYSRHPGVVAVYLPCAGLDPMWGHRRYDPIFQAAQDADLAVILHSVLVVHPVFPFNTHRFATDLARHSVGHPFSVMANLVDMVTSGVPVRFPKLRVAVTEAGVSWVPFLMNRLDKEYLEKRREVPYLTERPSHYLRKFYYATQPVEEPENLGDLVTLIDLYHGRDTTVFASDWPHHDFDHPSKVHQIPFPDEVKRKIFGENALRLLRIDEQGHRLPSESVS